MVGPNWPNDGEFDILEGVNDNANNAMTLHTSDGCSITDGVFTGTLITSNCYTYAPDQSNNAGCDIQDQNTQSYGNEFNSNGGGVIALQWTSSDINIWFFPRGTTPSDLEAGTPDPASWKEPVAQYQGNCNISSHFADMRIVRLTSPKDLLPGFPSFLSRAPYATTGLDTNESTPRSSTQTSAAPGLELCGVLALIAPPSPTPATTTCNTIRLLS